MHVLKRCLVGKIIKKGEEASRSELNERSLRKRERERERLHNKINYLQGFFFIFFVVVVGVHVVGGERRSNGKI